MMRLFVAIALPDDIRSRLALLCGGIPGAKWVAPETFHLNLRFIGEVDGGVARDIDAALTQVRVPAFPLLLTGIDCFAQGGKVRTLWVGVEAEPLLVRLRDKVESAVVRVGLEPERRKFKPHVTLARFRNGVADRVGSYFQRNNQFVAGPFDVGQFTLFRSHLTVKGPHYEVLADYPLETPKDAASLPPGTKRRPASAPES